MLEDKLTPIERARAELKKVQVWDEKEKRFTRINIPVEKLVRITEHFKAGGSMYGLHKGSKQMPVASVNTLRKVRDALKSRALDKVLAPVVGQILEHEAMGVSKDQIYDAQEILLDRYRLAFGGKTWEWDVGHLEEIGLYPDQAIDVLESYDKHYELSQEAQRVGRKFRGLNLYLAIHYIAIFHIRFPRAPFHYINMSAHGHAEILIEFESNARPGYTNYAMDMLRYEIWRTDKQLNAYYSALGRYTLSAKRIDQIQENIKQANQSSSYIHFRSDKDTLVQPPRTHNHDHGRRR